MCAYSLGSAYLASVVWYVGLRVRASAFSFSSSCCGVELLSIGSILFFMSRM